MRIIVFKYQNKLLKAAVADTGTLTIGTHGNVDLLAEREGLEQFRFKVRCSAECVEINGKPLHGKLSIGPCSVVRLIEDRDMLLMWDRDWGSKHLRLELPYNFGVLTLGRSAENDIVLTNRTISHRHLTIWVEGVTVYAEDGQNGRASTNGTYLNGRRIVKKQLQPGDHLDLMDVRISLKGTVLVIENAAPGSHVKAVAGDSYGGTQDIQRGRPRYHRSPRQGVELPGDEIVLAKPPSRPQGFLKNHHGLFSLFSTGAMLASTAAMGAVSPALLAARAASLVTPLSMAGINISSGKKNKKKLQTQTRKRYDKYSTYIDGQKARIDKIAQEQRSIIKRANPAPQECMETARTLSSCLWERNPNKDRDFLDVRIGMGYDRLCVPVKAPSEQGIAMEDDELEAMMRQIVDETEIVDDVPARVPLMKYSSIGVIGQRSRVCQLVKNMLVSLTTLHYQRDVRIVAFFDESERGEWEAVRWLPHIWDENMEMRFLSFRDDYTERLSALFYDVLSERLADEKHSRHPHYLFIFGSRRLSEHNKMVQLLLKNKNLGVTALFLFDEWKWLPSECEYIIDVEASNDTHYACAFETGATNRKMCFTPDPPISEEDFDRHCRMLSAVEVDEPPDGAHMPSSITFLQGFGVSKVTELDAWARWQKGLVGSGLNAPFAVLPDKKVFGLDVVRQGPHGLIGGSTGSGKSELLASWLLSMALHYSPGRVCFVVIDYKGGGLSNTFQGLPHLVGQITNLEGRIGRSMLGLYSETIRRQRMFQELSVSDISEYNAGLRDGRFKELLPHLLIIVDEFRELKKNEPEYMQALISIATIGRSLGIHLILCTQNPGETVDDQIRENSHFRICLKVESAEVSRSVIGTTDAACLIQAGRAYVKVGSNEGYDLVQSFWCGAPYTGKACSGDAGNQVRLIDENGIRLKTVAEEQTRFCVHEKELKVIVKYLAAVAEEHQFPAPHCPILPELPKRLVLEQLLQLGTYFDGTVWPEDRPWLKIPIGMYDAPAQQEQGVQYLELSKDGHYGIYGGPGTGKTTLLKTIALSLALTSTPEDVQLYLLDFGNWGLRVFQNMPHVRETILDGEQDKLNCFVRELGEELESRKNLLSPHTLSVYRQLGSEDIPAIIVLVDNLPSLMSAGQQMEQLLVQIARDGAALGIHLIYTSNNQNGIPYKFQGHIKHTILFEPTEQADYTMILGKPQKFHNLPELRFRLPNIKGRAYFKGTCPVEFQAALPMDGDDDAQRAAALEHTLEQMQNVWEEMHPEQRRMSMPEQVTWGIMQKDYTQDSVIPVGINCGTMEPAFLELNRQFCGLLADLDGCKAGARACLIACLMKRSFPGTRLFLLTDKRGLWGELEAVAESVGVLSEPDTTALSIGALLQEMVEREAICRQQDAELSPEEYPLLCLVMPAVSEVVKQVEPSVLKKIENIARLGKGLRTVILAGGAARELSQLAETEQLICTLTFSRSGMALEGEMRSYDWFCGDLELSYEEKWAQLGPGEGYLFDKAQVQRIRLMEEISWTS